MEEMDGDNGDSSGRDIGDLSGSDLREGEESGEGYSDEDDEDLDSGSSDDGNSLDGEGESCTRLRRFPLFFFGGMGARAHCRPKCLNYADLAPGLPEVEGLHAIRMGSGSEGPSNTSGDSDSGGECKPVFASLEEVVVG